MEPADLRLRSQVHLAIHKMSSPPAGSTEARPVFVGDDEQSFQERLRALEERERRAAEAEASCDSLEGPIALASKADLERILLRICSVSDVAKAIATEMLPTNTASASSTVASGSKRKASDAETIYRCSRCKLRFETDKNLPKDCIYHPGKWLPVTSCAVDTKCTLEPADPFATPQVARRSTRTLMTMRASGPTTTTPATDPKKVLPIIRSMRQASYGHAVIGEAMQLDVWRANMMSGSNGRVLDGKKALLCTVKYGPHGLYIKRTLIRSRA